MTAPAVAEPAAVYYSAQAAMAAQVTAQAAALWAAMDLADLDGSFLGIREELLAAIILGQLQTAETPTAYVARVLADDGLQPDPIAVVPPSAFAGRSAAGYSLTGPVDLAPVRVKQSLLAGKTLSQAAADGLAYLTRLAATEVADAGRGAMEAATRLEPQIVGYERYVNLPACDRCIILAGRVYRFSEGFLRHPECDCSHRPLTSRDARDGTEQEPSELFRSLTTEQQDQLFTKDGAEAIRRGADLSQVVNARQGMSAPGDPFTTAGSARRRRGQQRRARLSPQGVARAAGADDALYLELLRANRYIP